MKTIHALALASLLAAPAAFAQPIDAAAPVDAETQAALDAEAEADADVDRNCLRHTGSRIIDRAGTDKRKRDSNRGPCAIASGRVHTRGDLERTGHVTVEEALRALDPGIH